MQLPQRWLHTGLDRDVQRGDADMKVGRALCRLTRAVPHVKSQWTGAITRGCASAFEPERRIFWVTGAFVGGTALYFVDESLTEKQVALFLLPLICAGVIAYRHASRIFGCAVLVLVAAIGFFWASLRSIMVVFSPLERTVKATTLEGLVLDVEPFPERQRFRVRVDRMVSPETWKAFRAGETQVTLRSHARGVGSDGQVQPGDHIRVEAGLNPIPEPVFPGAYDPAVSYFFREISAVGWTLKPPEVVDGAGRSSSYLAYRNRMRLAAFRRIVDISPRQSHAVFAALVTGIRSRIERQTRADLRQAGVAHILAISGLHMGLLAGLVFGFVRALLALRPRCLLKWPIKKIAAGAGMLSVLLYLQFSGAQVSAQRAGIMAFVGFASILLNRRVCSLRNVAIAMLLVAVVAPSDVIGPGFQLSFAAATALVLAFNVEKPHRRRGRAKMEKILGKRPIRALRQILFVTIWTTLIASAVTAPIALWHFHQATPLGLVGNLVAIPLLSLVVMPAVAACLVLLPLGWEGIAVEVGGWAVERILEVSAILSRFEGVQVRNQEISAAGALVMVLGVLLIAARPRWALIGLAGVLIGSAIGFSDPRLPLMLVSRSGRTLLVAQTGPRVIASRQGYSDAYFLDRAGTRMATAGDGEGGVRPAESCQNWGCQITDTAMGKVYHVWRISGDVWRQACVDGRVIVSPQVWPRREACAAGYVIDATTLATHGAIALVLARRGDVLGERAAGSDLAISPRRLVGTRATAKASVRRWRIEHGGGGE